MLESQESRSDVKFEHLAISIYLFSVSGWIDVLVMICRNDVKVSCTVLIFIRVQDRTQHLKMVCTKLHPIQSLRKINADFESLPFKSEWKNYTALFLQRYNQREVDYALHATETQAKMQQLQAKAKLVHDELDEKLNDAKCKIADLEVQVSHDVQRLSKKFEGQHSESGKVCLEDRVKLSQCYNTLKDGGECEIFAKKLEKCVTDALAKA